MLKIFFSFFMCYFVMKKNMFIMTINVISLMILMIMGDMVLFNNYLFYMDMFSMNLTLLTFWLSTLSIISMKFLMINKNNKNLNLMMYLLIMSLLMTFSFKNSLMFYFSFEISLIPIFFIIMSWGSQSERIISGLYLMFYTLFGSFPFFYILVILNSKFFMSMSYSELFLNLNFYSFFIFLPFLVKFPMYMLHLWLLKAHVEAPVMGSMMLAGILLKLGGYGLIRTSFMWNLNNYMKEFLIVFSMWGGVIMALTCLCMIDMKLMVAMSSIVHMSFCVSGTMILSKLSIKGMLIMMVGHGLCSSGMFYICNLFYEMSFSRSLIMLKGLLVMSPSLMFWWFLLCSSNMSCPPSLNLISELMISISMMNWNFLNFFTISMILFFCSCYSLYLYFNMLHNNLMIFFHKFYNCLSFNMVLMCHWFPLNIFFLCLFIFC